MIWTLQAIWGFLVSSASVSTLIGGAAVAVAVLLPKQLDWITDLRKWAICVAVCAFAYSFVAGKFYHDGLAVKQAEWNAALAREAAQGEQARNDAVDSVGPMPAERGMFRGDPYNRDGRAGTAK